jgi:cytoskeleton protein RodZ
MSEADAILGREQRKSLGAQFAAAREKRGLTLERASSETCIRAERLREIERDDYSHFSHPSYARMFAIDYARYLGIPISRVRRLLPESGQSGGEGYQYLRETPCAYMRTDAGLFARRKRLLPKLGIAAVLVLLSLGGFKLWITFRDIERIGLGRISSEDKSILAAPLVPEAVPAARPENAGDSAGANRGQPEGPAAEVPRRPVSSDAESALLVGADLDHSDRIR